MRKHVGRQKHYHRNEAEMASIESAFEQCQEQIGKCANCGEEGHLYKAPEELHREECWCRCCRRCYAEALELCERLVAEAKLEVVSFLTGEELRLLRAVPLPLKQLRLLVKCGRELRLHTRMHSRRADGQGTFCAYLKDLATELAIIHHAKDDRFKATLSEHYPGTLAIQIGGFRCHFPLERLSPELYGHFKEKCPNLEVVRSFRLTDRNCSASVLWSRLTSGSLVKEHQPPAS